MRMQNTFINVGEKVYQKYLERHHRVSGDKHSENTNQGENYVTRRFIEESHNLQCLQHDRSETSRSEYL